MNEITFKKNRVDILCFLWQHCNLDFHRNNQNRQFSRIIKTGKHALYVNHLTLLEAIAAVNSQKTQHQVSFRYDKDIPRKA